MNRNPLKPLFLLARPPARLFTAKPDTAYQSLMHSKRQVKLDLLIRDTKPRRIHPRVEKLHEQLTQPLEPLKFKLQTVPENHDPLIPLGNTENLPFSVQRTFSGNLPVYSDFNHDHSIKKTIVRKITGDVEELYGELKKVCSNSSMKIQVGKIVIRGPHKIVVEDYLRRLGF